MSMKTAKAEVNPRRQRSQYTCMSTSMAMCLSAWGVPVTEDEVNKVMGARPMQGASWEQALACAQHYGMRATLTMPSTIEQLKEWTDAGIPVMIAWNPEGRPWSHASVVFDVDDEGNVHVADPNIPDPDETVRVVSRSDFYKRWSEKWPNYLVRRPACAIEREITEEGRQISPLQAKKAFTSKKVLKSASLNLWHAPYTHLGERVVGLIADLQQKCELEGCEASDAVSGLEMMAWDAGYAGEPLTREILELGKLLKVNVRKEHRDGQGASKQASKKACGDGPCQCGGSCGCKNSGYSGNPDGKSIYPNEIEHGYGEPVSGGTNVMRRLQDQLLHEQGKSGHLLSELDKLACGCGDSVMGMDENGMPSYHDHQLHEVERNPMRELEAEVRGFFEEAFKSAKESDWNPGQRVPDRHEDPEGSDVPGERDDKRAAMHRRAGVSVWVKVTPDGRLLGGTDNPREVNNASYWRYYAGAAAVKSAETHRLNLPEHLAIGVVDFATEAGDPWGGNGYRAWEAVQAYSDADYWGDRRASQDWVALFDSLKKGQTIQIAGKSVMGMGGAPFDGKLHPCKVGRKSHSKKYDVTTIILDPMDGRKVDRRAALSLRKRPGRGGEGYTVTLARGDMSMQLKDIKVASEPSLELLYFGKEAAGGLYGFPKSIESDCSAASRRVAKAATVIAKRIYAKDARVAEFWATHGHRASSLTANLLSAALNDVLPRTASGEVDSDKIAALQAKRDFTAAEKLTPESLLKYLKDSGSAVTVRELKYGFPDAGTSQNITKMLKQMVDEGKLVRDGKSYTLPSGKSASKYGLYGFKDRTSKLGLQGCTELRHEAGRVASDLHRRRSDKHARISGFLSAHTKEGGCRYSRLLLDSYPDEGTKLAAVEAPLTVSEWITWAD